MIDGIKLTCVGLDSSVWEQNKLLNFVSSYNHTTNEIEQRKEAKFQSLKFVIPECKACSINGSLHKYYNANDTNYSEFSYNQLIETINNLNLNFSIDLNTALIHNIEIGVNIELDYETNKVLKSLISHKKKSFYPLDRDNEKIGFECNHNGYRIKIYNKSLQSRLQNSNLLRYEIKIKKMRELNKYGIKTLSDLLDKDKVYSLKQLLLDKLNEIIFFDFDFDAKHLHERKRLKWKLYASPNFWNGKDREIKMNKETARYHREQYKTLINRYGCMDFNAELTELINKQWEKLFDVQAQKYPTFTPLEYTVQRWGIMDLKEDRLKEKTNRRFCVSCGRDITHQKGNSRFCSERLYGKKAKRCRNKDSNKRLTIKRQITRAQANGLEVDVTYIDNYKVRLKADTIRYNRALFDLMKSVEAVKPAPVMKSKHKCNSKSPP